MYAEKWEEEKFLENINVNIKKSDLVALYYVVSFLESKGYQIQFVSSKNFTISSSLIEEIKLKNSTFQIVLNFNTFFGYGGLLHDYLHEMFYYEKNNSLPDFLNIFYNRIVEIFFHAKKIYYPFFSNETYAQMYTSLTGLVNDTDLWFLKLGYFFIHNSKSKAGIKALLISFTKIDVEIVEFVGGYLDFDDSIQAKLLKTHRLNGEKHLGLKYYSQDVGFDVIFYPHDDEELHWLSNVENVRKLKILLNKFINSRVEFRLFVQLKKSTTCYLKRPQNNPSFLGMSTFLALKDHPLKHIFRIKGG